MAGVSLTNFIIRGDMRDYYRKRLEAGHRAGKEFLQRNKGADRAWLGGFLEEIDSSVERFTLPEALQDTNEKLGENVHNIVRPLTDPTSILTDYLKGNLPRAIVTGTISLACFHETKERLIKPGGRRLRERHPRRCKYAEPVTNYACDVLLPTGLYGPLFLYLLKKGREQLVYRTLLACRLID